eukprot:1851688-Rhodomonas_salina.1
MTSSSPHIFQLLLAHTRLPSPHTAASSASGERSPRISPWQRDSHVSVTCDKNTRADAPHGDHDTQQEELQSRTDLVPA